MAWLYSAYAYLHHCLKESVSFWVEYFGFRSVRSLHTSGTCTEAEEVDCLQVPLLKSKREGGIWGGQTPTQRSSPHLYHRFYRDLLPSILFLFIPSNRSGTSLHPLWLSCFQMLNWSNINFKSFLVLLQINMPKFQWSCLGRLYDILMRNDTALSHLHWWNKAMWGFHQGPTRRSVLILEMQAKTVWICPAFITIFHYIHQLSALRQNQIIWS